VRDVKRSSIAAAAATLGLVLAACESSAPVASDGGSGGARGANAILPWAYVLNDPIPDTAPEPDPDEIVSVPGSALSIRRAEINIERGPPDWNPDGRPPMPAIVARGREGVYACGYCHLPNGQGKPENAGLAGQPLEYLLQQLEDYRSGKRTTGEPRMLPPALMMSIGAALTEEEARIAAAYFSSLQFRPWIRVVETDEVPTTRFADWIHQAIEGGSEPIGVRIVEMPEDPVRTKLRDDASGFIAWVPRGAIARGAALVNDGARGAEPCTICHGVDLRGLGPIPAIAGRSPSYLARQLYDFQQGNRNGAWSELMDRAVANLTIEDIVDIVAYAANLDP
jgi:cytochrome c553